MAGKLSFAIAINLMTDGFKNGVKSVKSYLRSMQMQFLTFAAALGAGGLGLSNLVSKFIEVARETNRVTTALKNVSGSLSQYSDNQKFLIDLSNKYGLEINALTGNFAKFTASARVSGMAMDEQKKIFESVSRACTAFGMSADDSNSTFLALSQMMSKGKISSEELRLQMGERLPIALQAMAKAAGVSVGGLDKLLKQGKLMSADVLPKFADALNEMIPTIDTDNIETSVNRLKNTFTDLTKSLHIGDIYKKVVDMSASELEKIKNGVSNVVLFIVSLISGKLLTSVLTYFKNLTSLSDSYVRQSEIAQAQVLKATQNRTAAEKVLNTARTDYETLENGKRLASKKQVINAELALERAKAAETKAITAAKTASEKASLVTSTTWYGKFFTTIKLGASQALVALRSIWSAIAPMIIITALSFIVGKFIEMRAEANRIKNIFSDYKKEAEESGKESAKEINHLKSLYNIASNIKNSLDLRKSALKELNKELGSNYSIDKKTLKINGDINDKLKDRIKLIDAMAKADFYSQKKVEAEYNFNKANDEYRKGVAEWNSTAAPAVKIGDHERPLEPNMPFSKQNQLAKLYDKKEQYLKEWTDATKKNAVAEVYILKHSSKTKSNTVTDSDDKKHKKTDLEKAEEEYVKDLKELANQKENAVINEKEYSYLLAKLNIETNKKLSGLLTSDQAAKNKTYHQTKAGLPSNSKTFEESHKYQEELDKLSKLRSGNTINEKEYKEELGKLVESTIRACVGMDGLTMADNAFITALIFAQKQLKEKVTIPKETLYDNTFDYKKTKPEILSDRKASKENRVNDLKSAIGKDADSLSKDISEANLSLEQLKAKYKNVSGQLVELLNNAMSNVKDLGEALKIAQVKEDIKNLSKEINKGIYGSVKDVVSVADNLYVSLENVKEVMNDVDASEWDKFMTVWNAIISTTDGILSTIETIKSLIKIVEELTQAKQKEKAIDAALTDAKITNTTAQTTAEATALATQTTTEVAASVAKTTAATTEMAAKSTAAYAGIPFVGFGLAEAQIIAMQGLIAAAAIPKFANGGIVGGNSRSGDRIVAGVNSGEMILNMSQQSKLFKLANSGNLSSGGRNISVTGDVRFKIDGTTLVGVLKNINDRNKHLR